MTDGARMLIGITLFATLSTLLVDAGVAVFMLVEGVACLVWCRWPDFNRRAVEKRLSRRPHKPEVPGSTPGRAISIEDSLR